MTLDTTHDMAFSNAIINETQNASDDANDSKLPQHITRDQLIQTLLQFHTVQMPPHNPNDVREQATFSTPSQHDQYEALKAQYMSIIKNSGISFAPKLPCSEEELTTPTIDSNVMSISSLTE